MAAKQKEPISVGIASDTCSRLQAENIKGSPASAATRVAGSKPVTNSNYLQWNNCNIENCTCKCDVFFTKVEYFDIFLNVCFVETVVCCLIEFTYPHLDVFYSCIKWPCQMFSMGLATLHNVSKTFQGYLQ